MDSFLLSSGFTRCHSNSNVYILQKDDSHLLPMLYVDDLIIIGSRYINLHQGSLYHKPSILLIYFLDFK